MADPDPAPDAATLRARSPPVDDTEGRVGCAGHHQITGWVDVDDLHKEEAKCPPRR